VSSTCGVPGIGAEPTDVSPTELDMWPERTSRFCQFFAAGP
jgi:hypothetical protein